MKIDLSTSRHGRILQAVWSGTAARLLTTAVTLISLPLAVRYLGAERYGVWATITTTVVWINLLDLGIANTLTNHISRAYALDDKASAARYFTNALVLTVGIAGSVGLVFAVAFPRIDWVGLFNVDAGVSQRELKQHDCRGCCLDVAGIALQPGQQAARRIPGTPPRTATRLLRAPWQAWSDWAGDRATGFHAGVVRHVGGMPSTGQPCHAGCRGDAGTNRGCFRVRRSSGSSAIKELLDSGSSFFLIQIAAVVVFSSDNLVVSHYLGASEVTPYSVTWRLVGLAAMLQSLIFPALWPAYAEAYAKGDYDWIRRTFSITMKGTVALNFVMRDRTGTVLDERLIRVWAGPAAVPSLQLLLAMGIWAVVSGFMSVESCLLAALNRTRQQAVLSIVAAALNIALVSASGAAHRIAGRDRRNDSVLPALSWSFRRA